VEPTHTPPVTEAPDTVTLVGPMLIPSLIVEDDNDKYLSLTLNLRLFVPSSKKKNGSLPETP
jgi:hypothetical protein